MWTRNSSRKIEIPAAIDGGIEGQSQPIVVFSGGQLTPGLSLSQTSINRLSSCSRPPPCSIRYMIRSNQPDPSRHGVHWPHDSRKKNLVMRQDARTAQVVSSMTTTEPEPSIEPAAPTSSWPSGMSNCFGPNQGAETPPGTNALSSRSSRTPPPSEGA